MGATMKPSRPCSALAGLTITAFLFATPASAQAMRTWVSGAGNDANSCSRTAPCLTFAGAIYKTAASGEINCLDAGGFGSVVINKAITIDCQAVGGVMVSSGNGITVFAGGEDDVQLIGLDIDGLGTSLNGVSVVQARSVAIINCVIYGFQSSNGTDGAGVQVVAQDTVHVVISNTVIRDNTFGVMVNPNVQGFAIINGVLIEHSLLDRNATAALSLGNSSAVVALNGDSLLASASSISNPSGGQVISYGNNVIRNSGAPTSTAPLQ